ncbi:multiheme c-type cytochrome [Sphingomonas sp. MMS24-J13]|uniref:multiheme c-type cytochrome n=1 Tax=Sphingomonas sp. MMS24-J13 TaxID=3238686 RepID=UPI0038517826
MKRHWGQRWGVGAAACLLLMLLVLGQRAPAANSAVGTHLGVASCAGSTCHGRQEPTGAIVRQDEISLWQNAASQAGAHSRAWAVLGGARGRAIAARLDLGDPQSAPLCLGCHADPAPVRGPAWRVSDGVGCEACHGAASAPWLASHRATGATHASNIANGLYPIDQPKARATRCLDCHLGSGRDGQWVDHRIMAAGHPRISFELELFSALEQHWNEDGDYAQRKARSAPVRLWAVGQAAALERALTVYAGPRGQQGVFPDLAFFDCHACHRRIGDQPDFKPSALANPGRPLPPGSPPFQDENIIMLSAAAKVASPALAARFDRDARAFHLAMAQGRPQTVAAAGTLRASTRALGDVFAARTFSTADTFAVIDAVAAGAAARYTDYEASAQAVMALDSLLNSLVKQGALPAARAASMRGSIDAAYRAVRDPNLYQPLEFQSAMARAAAAIRGLR